MDHCAEQIAALSPAILSYAVVIISNDSDLLPLDCLGCFVNKQICLSPNSNEGWACGMVVLAVHPDK